MADHGEWVRQQQARRLEVRTRHAEAGGGGLAHAAAGAGPSQAEARKQFEALLRADLAKEALLYTGALDKALAGKPNFFGDPLDFEKPRNIARHSFWPAHQADMPLHFAGAKMLLGGQLTATDNERFHNVAGYICSKLRARMSDENMEYYSAAKVLLTKDLKVINDGLDAADAADELLEFPESSM